MKKFFALLLAFTLLFLTACNNNPADSTAGTDTGTGTGTANPQNPAPSNELELKDTIVGHYTREFINLPSRVIYANGAMRYYYSKADGKAYVYCFDPLCEHDDGYCLASSELGFTFENTFFINNRFYFHTGFGQIISFSFDGTDKKIEYNTDYGISTNPWGHCMAFGPFIYIDQRSYASEDGIAHTLRFNIETGEMVDLTEKTGNYIYPSFFYNGMLYGYDQGVGFLKADPDLTSCEEIERIPTGSQYLGSRFFSTALDEKNNGIGINIYDMKTGESEMITNETIGIENKPYILYVDENYIYFYQIESIYLGDIWFKDELRPKTKGNDGSIYRINHDGTGLVCIYEEEDFVITGFEATIAGDKFLVEGSNFIVRDNQVETWDKGVLVGTIGADGKIDELKPVEVVE
ncbi:MAG: hypothetical protein IJD59_03095 [Clostridia bacterium]|nr:hypothetical protein [Clostridia bacterium]